MALKIQNLVFNMFGENTYIVWDEATREAMIVDPGMIDPAEQYTLTTFISDRGLKPKYLVNTHMHLDHTFGDEYVMAKYNLPLLAHEAETPFGLNREAQARSFGIRMVIEPLQIDGTLQEGDKLTLGKAEIEILHVPGHSPGSIVLYSPDSQFIIAGDVLFRSSIGRTDLAMGNHEQLIYGIRNKLLTLPDATTVYPGHGPKTTIGYERQYNPYL